jgi:beta-phosphoglucomutase
MEVESSNSSFRKKRPMTVAREAVIFDVDGVLVDSYRAHFRSWQILAAELGREYTEEQFVAGFGRTSREIIAEQWDDGRLNKQRIRELDARKEAIYRELISRHFPAMGGAAELIQALSEAGFALAVGSSGPPENVSLVLERLAVVELIDAQVTGADVTRGKPDPQVFQLAAHRLGLPAANCVVIEDAPSGIEAARRAGMKCIGLAGTGRTVEELREADFVVQSLQAVSVERIRQLL